MRNKRFFCAVLSVLFLLQFLLLQNPGVLTVYAAISAPTPAPITVAIAGGGSYNGSNSIVVKNDGTVWTWGRNEYGQLGDGTTEDKRTPVQVHGLDNVIAIAGGSAHTLAVRNDGTVWTWGRNAFSQLGDGTTEDKRTPVQVKELDNVATIAGGFTHSIAVRNDGTVWTWGNNDYGQLGDGTTWNKSTPVQVQGLSNVIAIEGGYNYTVAVKSDGTVWTWGNNDYGQLGDGTTKDKRIPVQVEGLDDVISIAGGYHYTLAVKNDGTVWTWGNNDYGQLGDGTTEDERTPVQVQGLSNVIAIAGGSAHAIAVKKDEAVWTWGRNNSGQLGDGTSTSKRTPVQVQALSNTVPPVTPAPATKTFNDLENYPWAKDAILALASKEIVKGTSETTFEPDKNIIRADFITLLVRVFNLKADIDSNFDDVSPDDYYYQAVGIAKKLGITNGGEGNKFNPRDPITREDLMVLVARTLKVTGKASTAGTFADISSFSDAAQVTPYAVEGVAALIKEGIVKGSGEMIHPKSTATRAETVVIIYRIFNGYMQ